MPCLCPMVLQDLRAFQASPSQAAVSPAMSPAQPMLLCPANGPHWDKSVKPPVLQTHQLLLLHQHKHFSKFHSARNNEEHQALRAKGWQQTSPPDRGKMQTPLSLVPSSYLLAAHKNGEILIPHRWENHHLNKTSLMIVTEGTFNIACTWQGIYIVLGLYRHNKPLLSAHQMHRGEGSHKNWQIKTLLKFSKLLKIFYYLTKYLPYYKGVLEQFSGNKAQNSTRRVRIILSINWNKFASLINPTILSSFF